jgi:acyl-CoA thioesterase I
MKFTSQLLSMRLLILRRLTVFIGVFSLLSSINIAYAELVPDCKILVLGDSVSAAYGMRQHEGWVPLLQKEIADQATLINASFSGETTAGGLNRLPALLKEHQPHIVIIELGGNDGLRGYPVPSIRKNLQNLITLSSDAGAQVLLIGMKIPPNYGKPYTRAFEENYTLLAKENDLPLVPFLLESVAGNNELMQSDGIHPTANAQPLIVQNVLPSLRAMLD